MDKARHNTFSQSFLEGDRRIWEASWWLVGTVFDMFVFGARGNYCNTKFPLDFFCGRRLPTYAFELNRLAMTRISRTGNGFFLRPSIPVCADSLEKFGRKGNMKCGAPSVTLTRL